MRKVLIFCMVFGLWGTELWGQVPSPTEFLGYPLGSRFSWHHQVVDYFEAVAESSPRVRLQPYGESYEGRPLMVAFLSTEENLANLEEIRQNNLKATGLATGDQDGQRIPIVWLSYNIHGNESVSTEAAMATLYQLVANDTAGWLEDLIVVIDPCINPDGRDRYVNWYKQARNFPNQVESGSYEHQEPWPGGRFNHYLFDLNRDWAWQTQQESQQRANLYQRWMPQVHVDFHEMGPESPYFFAPAANPLHEVITDWQIEFQEKVGRNNARYFDRENWLYFTKESFDLFYPSYGDTWPTYQGAIGFTYEQGGSGRAGLGYLRSNGDTLTLADRMAHHYTTSLSTVETSHRNRERLLDEFDQFFSSGTEGNFEYKTYIISQENPAGKLNKLMELLDQHQIQYGTVKGNRVAQGYDYAAGENGSMRIAAGDLAISAAQPQGNLVTVLFEPIPFLEDSLTYDLTAWALPYAYNLKSLALKEKLSLDPYRVTEFEPNQEQEADAYAYLLRWEDMRSAQWLADMMEAGMKVSRSDRELTFGGETFARGTLVATKADNPFVSLGKLAVRLANQYQLRLYPVKTGFADGGPDLGSSSIEFMAAPKVALMRGEGVSTSRFGELWYFFERELGYPLHTLSTDHFRRSDLSKYDVLILPEGRYNNFSSKIYDFARQGGRVIALEGAIGLFASSRDAQSTDLSRRVQGSRGEQSSSEPSSTDDSWLKRYDSQAYTYASNSVPGAIFKVNLDDSHPLAYGLGDTYYALKHNNDTYPYLKNGWNVGNFPQGKPLSGFAGYQVQESIANSLAIGVERYGRGDIVYLVDSPVFRAFWQGGKLLLANAIFFR